MSMVNVPPSNMSVHSWYWKSFDHVWSDPTSPAPTNNHLRLLCLQRQSDVVFTKSEFTRVSNDTVCRHKRTRRRERERSGRAEWISCSSAMKKANLRKVSHWVLVSVDIAVGATNKSTYAHWSDEIWFIVKKIENCETVDVIWAFTRWRVWPRVPQCGLSDWISGNILVNTRISNWHTVVAALQLSVRHRQVFHSAAPTPPQTPPQGTSAIKSEWTRPTANHR